MSMRSLHSANYCTSARDLTSALDLNLARALEPDLDSGFYGMQNCELYLERTLDADLDLDRILTIHVLRALRDEGEDEGNIYLASMLDLAQERSTPPFQNELKVLLQELPYELPALLRDFPPYAEDTTDMEELYFSWQSYIDCWVSPDHNWCEQLQQVIISYRNIGHDWELDRQRFKSYLEANKLLADCLNTDCDISHDFRQEIEATMLMPQSFINEYRQKKKQNSD